MKSQRETLPLALERLGYDQREQRGPQMMYQNRFYERLLNLRYLVKIHVLSVERGSAMGNERLS